jgi:hypothetical protein
MRALAVGLVALGLMACSASAPPAEPPSPIPGLQASRAAPAPAPASATRLAVASTNISDAVRVTQLVEFNADGRVIGVCLVIVKRDSSRLYLPFADAALGRPSLQPPRCQ